MKKLLKVVMMLTVAVSVVQASSVSIMKKNEGAGDAQGLGFLDIAQKQALADLNKALGKPLVKTTKRYNAMVKAVQNQVAAAEKDAYKGNNVVDAWVGKQADLKVASAAQLEKAKLKAKNINQIKDDQGNITWIVLDEYVDALIAAQTKGLNVAPIDLQLALTHEAEDRFEDDSEVHFLNKELPEMLASNMALANKDTTVLDAATNNFVPVNKDNKASRLVIVDPSGSLASLKIAELFSSREFVIVKTAGETKDGDRVVVLSNDKALVDKVKGFKIPLDISGIQDGNMANGLITTAFFAAAVFYSDAYSVADALEVFSALQMLNGKSVDEEAFKKVLANARSTKGISIDDLMNFFAIVPAAIQDLNQLAEQARRIRAVASKA